MSTNRQNNPIHFLLRSGYAAILRSTSLYKAWDLILNGIPNIKFITNKLTEIAFVALADEMLHHRYPWQAAHAWDAI